MIPLPFDFSNLQYSSNDIGKRLQMIRQTFPNVSNAHLISLYLTSVIQPLYYALKRITTPNFTLESFYNKTDETNSVYERFLNPSHSENPLLTIDEISSFIYKVIPYTRFTYRQNLFYLGFITNGFIEKDVIFNYKYLEEKRIKYTYSYNHSERTIEGEQPYWFNAENIYQKHVIEKKCVIINSYTDKEEKTLYDKKMEEKEEEIFYLLRN